MAFDVKILSIPISDPEGADTLLLFKAPTDSQGGGIRLLAAEAVNHAATGSGTSFSYALHKYSNAGTPAVNGTISDTIGGTASPWADSVPKSFTLDSDYTFIDAGEWVALSYVEQTNGAPTNGVISLKYVMGK